jgi:hypothetical protein
MTQTAGQKNPTFESHNCVRCGMRIASGQGYTDNGGNIRCVECDAEATYEQKCEEFARNIREAKAGWAAVKEAVDYKAIPDLRDHESRAFSGHGRAEDY